MIGEKAGIYLIDILDPRFGFGVLPRSTAYFPVGVRGNGEKMNYRKRFIKDHDSLSETFR